MSTIAELRELLDSEQYDFRYDIGIAQPSQSVEIIDRDRIVQGIASHYAIIRVKAELDQILEGLNTLELQDLIRQNPQKMRPLFLHADPVPLTADQMIDLFTTKFSPVGSNRREVEEAIVMHWVNFIQMIESEWLCVVTFLQFRYCFNKHLQSKGFMRGLIVYISTDGNGVVDVISPDGEQTEFHISFEDILAFTTGSPSSPPLGFQPAPSLSFITTSPYPRANTCSNTLNLPMLQPLVSFERFGYYMSSGILNAAGFGRV